MGELIKKIGSTIGSHIMGSAVNPAINLVESNVSDIVTTIGSFVIRKVRGKFQRSITFTYGMKAWDMWQKPALFSILAKYNDFSKVSALELTCSPDDASLRDEVNNIRYELADGTHNVKYRKWNLLLNINHSSVPSNNGMRVSKVVTYTLITFDLDPMFVKLFEYDMKDYRNKLTKLKPESPVINIYKDYHEPDGYTYWDKIATTPKRKINTIYLPNEQKRLLIDSINNFYSSKKYYIEKGIPWNFKILLHGKPGCGKDSIARMIASEWNRNLYVCNGGKMGKFIPNAISDDASEVMYPMMLISDIDRYPAIINEPKIDPKNADEVRGEVFEYKQTYANMLNALDGLLSPGGRLIVLTCNDITKLSETLIRPGRIDLILEIKPVIPETFCQFVFDTYNVELDYEKIKLSSDELTIATLQFDVICNKLTADEFIKKYTVE